ncbi:MAG: L,D-transpeptidase [Anaerolineales bacterium]|jgi:hypothetical protein
MSKHWIGIVLVLVFSLQTGSTVFARAEATTGLGAEPAQAFVQETSPPTTLDYLCTVRMQLRYPGLCPNLGPAGELAELARLGMYPMRPLPTVEPVLNPPFLDFVYVGMKRDGTPLYASPADAFGGGSASSFSPRGFVFYSYFGKYTDPDDENSIVYRTQFGYVREQDVTLATIAGRKGMAFSRNPDRPFGWIAVGGTCSQTSPDSGEYSGNCYVLHQVVQIYGSEQVGDWTWYRIGPEEWMEQRTLALVFPDGTPPEGVGEDERWIVVDLYEQTVMAYDAGLLVYATVTSTGLSGMWTRPGLHQVWVKLDADDMTGGEVTPDGSNYYFLDNVPWVMYFDGARALHGTYWHNKFGTQSSRGCVNLTKADAHWFYDFTEIGTWIYVHDPSGATPTDPSMYGEGGA